VSSIEGFGETGDVAITVLVENNADLLVKSTESVKRFTDKPLLAEHGFAALVELKEAGVCILWDAGISTTALLENARMMKLDLTTVDAVALSHGHRDHYAAMTDVLGQIVGRPGPREWPHDAPM
jgi:7,8-dihydropterin-6-yl-methyl-4-(beta-D-ribofuranosyl)aminobenzene 5'-phosphate synthase